MSLAGECPYLQGVDRLFRRAGNIRPGVPVVAPHCGAIVDGTGPSISKV